MIKLMFYNFFQHVPTCKFLHSSVDSSSRCIKPPDLFAYTFCCTLRRCDVGSFSSFSFFFLSEREIKKCEMKFTESKAQTRS